MKTWHIPKIWEGSDVWILGGGPSIIDNFDIPLKVVEDVRFKRTGIEAYSPYLAALNDKHVIGINVAYKLSKCVDICFFGDKNFYLSHRNNLQRFRKLVVTCDEYVGARELDWIKYLEKEEAPKGTLPNTLLKSGISTRNNAVRWNLNSGAAAISLAYWLGAKRVILVGFDMKLNATDNKHFHNEYIEKGKRNNPDPNTLPFNAHLRGFPTIKADADRLGLEILNVSLDSAITEFPKVNIKELL